MVETIDRLLTILNKYSTAELNKMYRDREVELEIESFTKHSDVRWSEDMKKRMIQAAKRKRISPGKCKYIEEQVDELNNYNIKPHLQIALSDVEEILKNVDRSNINKGDIFLLHIEFSDAQHIANVEAYGEFKDKWYENELGRFNSNFNSAKYWDELESRKFNAMYEQLEIVTIDDEEYPQIYQQLRELRVFNVIKHALSQPEIKKWISNDYPQVRIEIGMHGHDFHTIHQGK